MSKYGGSEKTTQAFVAAYNKPRGSGLAPLEQRRPPASSSAQGGRVFSPPLGSFGLIRAREGRGGLGIPGGQSLLDVTGPSSRGPSQGSRRPLPPLVIPDKIELSVPFDPP